MPTVITLSLTLIEDSRDLSHENINEFNIGFNGRFWLDLNN